MHFFILVLLLCFFIFLFSLYVLSHDDFVLLRRDISTDSLFNISLLVSPLSLISARLLYVVTHPSRNFLNPLYFLLFPYFPGLSLLGGVLGAVLFLFLIFRARKMPAARLLDLFSLSAASFMPIGAIGYFLLSGSNLLSLGVLFTVFSYIFLFLFFVFFLLPRFLKGRVREGNMGTLFLAAYSLISLLGRASGGKFSLGLENILLILLLISSAAFFIRKEKLILKLKK